MTAKTWAAGFFSSFFLLFVFVFSPPAGVPHGLLPAARAGASHGGCEADSGRLLAHQDGRESASEVLGWEQRKRQNLECKGSQRHKCCLPVVPYMCLSVGRARGEAFLLDSAHQTRALDGSQLARNQGHFSSFVESELFDMKKDVSLLVETLASKTRTRSKDI